MKTLITCIISICILSTLNAQTKVEISDFEILNNTNWKGTLTYKDYTSGKETTLKTTMSVFLIKNKVVTEIKFPGEPKANSKSTTKLKKNGTYYGNEKVITNEILEDGTVKITTFFVGKDNYKKARMYKTYTFNKTSFSIVKEVQYLGSDEKFIRNKQNYKRI